MAAVTAAATKPDVAYKGFETGNRNFSDQTEKDTLEDDHSEANIGKKFTLGAEDGSELLDEFAFSLQHSSALPRKLQADIHSEMARLHEEEIGSFKEGQVEGQPPPGHWVGQPSGNTVSVKMKMNFIQLKNVISLNLLIVHKCKVK